MDKERHLRTEIGLWIDHKEAIIVSLKGDAEETKRSLRERKLRLSGVRMRRRRRA